MRGARPPARIELGVLQVIAVELAAHSRSRRIDAAARADGAMHAFDAGLLVELGDAHDLAAQRAAVAVADERKAVGLRHGRSRGATDGSYNTVASRRDVRTPASVESVREDRVARIDALECADVRAAADRARKARAALIGRQPRIVVAGVDRGTADAERMRFRRSAVVG